MIFFQDFPGPGILKKKSRTFQEEWEPWKTFHSIIGGAGIFAEWGRAKGIGQQKANEMVTLNLVPGICGGARRARPRARGEAATLSAPH